MQFPLFLLHFFCLLGLTTCLASPDADLGQLNDTDSSLNFISPSFEAERAKSYIAARSYDPYCANVLFNAHWSQGRIYLIAVYKTVGKSFYLTSNVDFTWHDPRRWVLQTKVPSTWPDPSKLMAIRWADCRLKYDEAVDILAGSGIMKNQDFDGMTAQWDDKPSQVYYEFKSQQQPNLIWRVGMNTRNVDFKPNEAPKAVSDADGGVKGDFADPSWFDTLASVDGKDVDSEGVAAA